LSELDEVFARFEEAGKKKEEPKKEEKVPEKSEEPVKVEQKPAPESPLTFGFEPSVTTAESKPETVETTHVPSFPFPPTEEAPTVPEEKKELVPPTPPPVPTPLITPSMEEEFAVKEATEEGAIGTMIYAGKGEGKTVLAMSHPGKVAVLSFDRQALPVKKNHYNNDSRLQVYDAIMHYNKASADLLLSSSDKTYRFVNAILDLLEKNPPDVIILDGSEILHVICEMTMRYRNNLQPFQGITNRNLWKERNMYVDQVFLRSLKIAKQTVICTAYIDKDEIIKEGEFVTKDDVPKWVGTIMTDTRVVIRVKPNVKQGIQKFYAWIQSSKDPRYKTGSVVDITGTEGIKTIWDSSKT